MIEYYVLLIVHNYNSNIQCVISSMYINHNRVWTYGLLCIIAFYAKAADKIIYVKYFKYL